MSGVSTTSSTTLRTDVSSKVLPGDKSGLPLEIWQIIFSYLSVKDLCYVARVSKTWYDLALSIDVTRWKELYLACKEWRHPYWPLNGNLEPSSWKLAYRNQHMSTRFWYRWSLQARNTGCMTLLKRVKERQTIEVGPGLQHETLKSAFAIANDYDKILVHPGIYDEQVEMSLKVPFELVGVGELGSVILVVCLEHVAPSGRFSNLVLRAPWFTNFIFKVRSGYVQMDNCIVEDGMMCVVNPAACHVQFCTFRHATVILQHVNASIIRNCEFSQSDNANIVVEGYPKEEKCWAYPYLCQEMDSVFVRKQTTTHLHALKVTDSTTSTAHSTFTGKSFTASTIRTFDTLSRERAGSHGNEGEGAKFGAACGGPRTGYGSKAVAVTNYGVHGQQRGGGLEDSVTRPVNTSRGLAGNRGGGNVGENRTSFSNGAGVPFSNGAGVPFSDGSGVPFSNRTGIPFSNGAGVPFLNGASMSVVDKDSQQPCSVCSSQQQRCQHHSSDTGPHSKPTNFITNNETCEGKGSEDEWLEINDERKDWQIRDDERQDRAMDSMQHPQSSQTPDQTHAKTSIQEGTSTAEQSEKLMENPVHYVMACNANTKSDPYPIPTASGNSSNPKLGDASEKHSEKPPQHVVTTDLVPEDGASCSRYKSGEESLPQANSLYREEGFFNGDEFPQNLPPLNSCSARYHYHHPPLLHNPHPNLHPHPSSHPEGPQSCSNAGVLPQADGDLQLPDLDPRPGDGEAAERRSLGSSGGLDSSEDDDLSILNALEAAASSGGSNHGNDSSSSSDDDSEVEEYFHGNSEYDSSDAEESVIMLPHLRQKHLDASLSANAVNADVGSICSQTSPPITLSMSQDEGVLSYVHKVRGCLVHQCRMMHSKGGVMVTLQGHALLSASDLSNVSYGIRCIQNARVVVVKNRIHHCRTSGIFMRLAASGLIAGNDLHSNNEAGLDIRKNADPIVQHNRIHHGKRSGVVVLGSGRGQIRCNNIYSNNEAGIYILYGGNPTVSENHIYDGKAAGVAVNEGGQGYIFDNTISSNTWGGVDIRRGSCPMVCRNIITNGLGDGIVIGDQGQGIIENNVIADNAGCGVWLMSASRPYIHGNQISNNGDTGVMMVNKTDIQQEGSHMLGPGGEGSNPMSSSLSVMGRLMDGVPNPSPKCDHTTLQHNNIYHNAGRGVGVELGEKVEVRYNAIYGNQRDGVWLHQDSPVTLLANSITSNHGHGVVTALTPSVEIHGNGIYDNREWGVQCSGQLSISSNDIVGNHNGGITVENQSVCKIEGNRIQASSGSGVKVSAGVKESVVQGNTLFHTDPRPVLDLSQVAVVRDNKVVTPTSPPDKESSRHKSNRDLGGFNKTQYLRDPPPRPSVPAPPPPSTLPAHNISSVTKVMVPSGETCQQGSKLCTIL